MDTFETIVMVMLVTMPMVVVMFMVIKKFSLGMINMGIMIMAPPGS
jgi:hypothetical protein